MHTARTVCYRRGGEEEINKEGGIKAVTVEKSNRVIQ